MVLKDLIGAAPTPATERPPGITCEKYTRREAAPRTPVRREMGVDEPLQGRADGRVECLLLDEHFGRRPGLVASPRGEGGRGGRLVDQPGVEREQAEEHVVRGIGGVGHAGSPDGWLPGGPARLPRPS
jgi:hypothetical protein